MYQLATDGKRTELPMVKSAMHAHVRGAIASVTLDQTYANTFSAPIEAVYVFPLPHDGAVGAMSMTVGDHIIRSVIKTRDEATQTYQRAKQNGQTAALLEQERPNIFTQLVANILPGEQIVIELNYDILLSPEHNQYELALPTVVGPRYLPSGVADAARITPPTAMPGHWTGNAFTFDLDVDAGLPLASITSPTHVINTTRFGKTGIAVTLTNADAAANKDVVVRWSLDPQTVAMSVLSDHAGDIGHLALTIVPPTLASHGPRPDSREMVFVLDTSGSMSGEPLALVKRAVRFGLNQLGPTDRFRIINFSADASAFDGGAMQYAERDKIRDAQSWLDGPSAGGGTEMLSGIKAAFMDAPTENRDRYVCFLTDGYIGNDAEIVAAIRTTLPTRTHVFSFGVGSSVNRSLIEEMGKAGRGVASFMLLDGDPVKTFRTALEQLAEPALNDLKIDWGGLVVEDVDLGDTRDLFAGEPLVITARYRDAKAATVELSGIRDNQHFAMHIPVKLAAEAGDGETIGRLWARRRIAALSRASGNGASENGDAITAIALKYSLLSAKTSFVAVLAERRTNDVGATVEVPVDLPEGVSLDAVGSNRLVGAEQVQITSHAPIIDPATTVQGITLDKSYIQNIPVPGRTFDAALGAAGGAQGESGVEFSGSSSLENVYDIGSADRVMTLGTIENYRFHLALGGAFDFHSKNVATDLSASFERRFIDYWVIGASANLFARDQGALWSLLATLTRGRLFGYFEARVGVGVGAQGLSPGFASEFRISRVLPIGESLHPELSLGVENITGGSGDSTRIGLALGVSF